MRVRTLEIRWHDSKPICTCDFQPSPYKKARPANEKDFVSQSYRLATGGEDNNVRVSIAVEITRSLYDSLGTILTEMFLWLAMDGVSEYPPTKCSRGRVFFDWEWRSSCATTATNRVSRDSEQAFCSGKCCAILPKWYVFVLFCDGVVFMVGCWFQAR